MMKFASFETVVDMIYHRLPGSKSDYGKGAQTAVSFTAGYSAGILCAIVSHPADVMVSKLNANRQAGEGFGAAVGRIYKDIGFGGLWNGLPVRIVMVGTLTGLQWMIYDSYKIYMGVSWIVLLAKIQQLTNEIVPYHWRRCSCRETKAVHVGEARLFVHQLRDIGSEIVILQSMSIPTLTRFPTLTTADTKKVTVSNEPSMEEILSRKCAR